MPGGSYSKPGNWRTLKRRVIARDGGLCACGAAAVTADHITPVSQDGGHDMGNLQAICQPCHDAKSKAEAAAGRRTAAAHRRTQQTRNPEPHPGELPDISRDA